MFFLVGVMLLCAICCPDNSEAFTFSSFVMIIVLYIWNCIYGMIIVVGYVSDPMKIQI